MALRSKRKGQRVEREASAFLQSLGFVSARRTAQKVGGPETPDVKCDELSRVHIEVKGDESIDLGRQSLRDALQQATRDGGEAKTPAVLWKRNRTGWRLSFLAYMPLTVATVDSDDEIRTVLQWLQSKTKGTDE